MPIRFVTVLTVLFCCVVACKNTVISNTAQAFPCSLVFSSSGTELLVTLGRGHGLPSSAARINILDWPSLDIKKSIELPLLFGTILDQSANTRVVVFASVLGHRNEVLWVDLAAGRIVGQFALAHAVASSQICKVAGSVVVGLRDRTSTHGLGLSSESLGILNLASGKWEVLEIDKAGIPLAGCDSLAVFAFGLADNSIRIVRLADRHVLTTLTAEASPSVCEFSEDGRYLACLAETTTSSIVQVWECKTWTEKRRFSFGRPSGMQQMVFSADSSLLAVTDGDAIAVLDTNLWSIPQPSGILTGSKILSICISPDRQWLLTGDTQQVVREWRLDGARLKKPMF